MKSSSEDDRGMLACLGDSSRFRIVSELARGALCVTEVARAVTLSQSCTTRHLQVLGKAGLVSGHRHGKRVVFSLRLEDARARDLLSWVVEAVDVPRREHPLATPRTAQEQPSHPGAVSPSHTSRNSHPASNELEDFLL